MYRILYYTLLRGIVLYCGVLQFIINAFFETVRYTYGRYTYFFIDKETHVLLQPLSDTDWLTLPHSLQSTIPYRHRCIHTLRAFIRYIKLNIRRYSSPISVLIFLKHLHYIHIFLQLFSSRFSRWQKIHFLMF